MATLVGGITTSHVPAIGRAIARDLQARPVLEALLRRLSAGARLARPRSSPTSRCVLYNDHGLNFFLDKMPTFAVGAAPEYRNADEGWGIPTVPPFKGEQDLSWHLIESLVGEDFDLTTCQEMLVDHAFTLPMALLWPDQQWPVTVVPVCINTVQFPLPSARALLQARPGDRPRDRSRGTATTSASWCVGTGGLSHQLDGERAGFINKDFDLKFMDSLVDDPTWATQYSIHDLVELTGTQGVELLMWLATRGALGGTVRKVHANYHIPISNTAAGLMVLENAV